MRKKNFFIKLIKLISILLTTVSTKAIANGSTCQTIFDTVHFNSQYNSKACPDNIFHLIKSLKSQHSEEDFSNSKVLYLYSRWTGTYRYDLRTIKFHPLRSRNGIKNIWQFHVVLLHKGLIYDFDYGLENIAIPQNEYFEKMFGAKWSLEQGKEKYSETVEQNFKDEYDEPTPSKDSKLKMHVRAIPIEVYENEYSFNRSMTLNPDNKNYVYWIYGDSRFPDLTLREFLNKKSFSSDR